MKEYKVEVTENSTKWYNPKGQLHREDGPAVEYTDGYKSYYINDKRHREDGPAMEYTDGSKSYYINDEELTEKEFKYRTKTCEGKVVEIEGVKYKLTQI